MKSRVIDLIFDLKSSCISKEEEIRNKLSLSPAELRGIISFTQDLKIQSNILCRKMGLTKSRGSRVIHRLINNGYLKIIKNNGDKRTLNISLTIKGIRTLENIDRMLENCENTFKKKLSKEEIKAFKNSLKKINNILYNY